MVSEDRLKQLIEIKNKQRAALKAEYVKQITDPYKHGKGQGGAVFDYGIQRWMAMEATKYSFFKPNARQAVFGIFSYIIPVGLTMYFVKTQRTNFVSGAVFPSMHYKEVIVSLLYYDSLVLGKALDWQDSELNRLLPCLLHLSPSRMPKKSFTEQE